MYKLLPLLLFSTALAQFSASDINRFQNEQLDLIRSELKQASSTENQLSENLVKNSENKINNIFIEKSSNEESNEYFFGYSYFDRSLNFYDNIPAPDDFKLGPGDEIILSMWGETNLRESFVINKDGLIYYKNIGLINLSNKTLKEAEDLLKVEFKKIFSTIGDEQNPTNLMLELGQLKSLNVYFTGQVKNPGINLVHPFSDIFSALVQSGGVKQNGSLRNIKVLRKNKEIATIDFYDFFVSGKNNFSNIKLIDGDVIHIPVVKNRVEIIGQVNNNGKYEILETESLNQLISFAGGLTELASNVALLNEIQPSSNRLSDDMAKRSKIVNLKSISESTLNNGTLVDILTIADNSTNVEVFGRVVRPGEYPSFEYVESNSEQVVIKPISLKKVLDAAGGFNDLIFRKTIVDEIIVLRLDEEKFYSQEIEVNYNDANDFFLEINDKILVYEKPNYENVFSYTIQGEINKPGTYPLRDGLSLQQALDIAGGITEFGSINSISVSQLFNSLDENGNEMQQTALVGNIKLDFEISDGSVISILPKTNVVSVEGNVYSPGLVAHSGRGMSMMKAIELAGGFKPNSLKKRSYVIRANGEIEKADFFRGRAKRVFPGDSIFVPSDPEPSDFDITSFIADLSSTLANLAAILVIIDRD